VSHPLAEELFKELIHTYHSPKQAADKYPALRTYLEKACVYATSGLPLSFKDLFARMNYLFDAYTFPAALVSQLHGLRLRANKWLHAQELPDEAFLPHDIKALALAIERLFDSPCPEALKSLPTSPAPHLPHARPAGHYPKIRVVVHHLEDERLWAMDEEWPLAKLVAIRIHVPNLNEAFTPSLKACQPKQQLNLLDVQVDEQGVYTPTLFIVEPDYLLDISSLAACFRQYASHPLFYLESKLKPYTKTAALLMGNMANNMLDEWVNREWGHPPDFKSTMQQAFAADPFGITSNDEIDAAFFEEARRQFNNIGVITDESFTHHQIDRNAAVLEPAFICEALGIQGRLDLLTWDAQAKEAVIVELKSGKTPFPNDNHRLVDISHGGQAMLYKMVVAAVFGLSNQATIRPFILYSKATEPATALRPVHLETKQVHELLNLRNLIVLNEEAIAFDSLSQVAAQRISEITPNTVLANANLNNHFIQKYIVPQIHQFALPIQTASPKALAYFYAFFQFVTLEQYLSKAGDMPEGSRQGAALSWRRPYQEKMDSGDLMAGLSIFQNDAHENSPRIVLKKSAYIDDQILPNFRVGDIVILYACNGPQDSVQNKQVFKGGIAQLTDTEITIELRYKQNKKHELFIENQTYAIEHDHIDSGYSSMFRGLYALLLASSDRRSLLLGEKVPQFDTAKKLSKSYRQQGPIDCPELDDILLRAKQASDYFLLIGPPGTGKTSVALRCMVEEFLTEENSSLLLLSYTNRAVDEICDALNEVSGQPSYARIGNALSCAPEHRSRLLANQIKGIEKRDQLKAFISGQRIIVGTVAALAGKLELFDLLQFSAVIVDEASQIIEPALMGILTAQNRQKKEAIQKMIFIGDHKQLPAVVLQSSTQSMTADPLLLEAGVQDRSVSLFERLLRLVEQRGWTNAVGKLTKQGRMHPDIARFPNEAFYNSTLEPIPVPHQIDGLSYRPDPEKTTTLKNLMATQRLVFIASSSDEQKQVKTHDEEANYVADLLMNLYALYQESGLTFSPESTVGVITPYRSQIALINQKIYALNIEALRQVTVDTVERFQGSQRDVIIYSFTVNELHQLDFLANMMEDQHQLIDRKLNVAITRARKQLFVLGNPSLLKYNAIYAAFLDHIRTHGTYIE
jgi:hypothetical protein